MERDREIQVVQHFLWRFTGGFPEVPFAPGVNVQELNEIDPDPLYVTLPFVIDGGKASNGLFYSKAFNDALIEQVNAKRPTGSFGHHIGVLEATARNDVPPIIWVGATRDSEGRGWIKGFVRDRGVKEYLRALKAAGSSIGTSIVGSAPYEAFIVYNADDEEGFYFEIDPQRFSLISVDVVEPERAALQMPRPYVLTANSKETPSEDTWVVGIYSGLGDFVAEDTKPEVLRNLSVTQAAEVDGDIMEDLVEMTEEPVVEEAVTPVEAEEVSAIQQDISLVEALQGLQEEIAALTAEKVRLEQELLQFRLREEVQHAVGVPISALQKYVQNAVMVQLGQRTDVTQEELRACIQDVLSTPEYKELAKSLVYQASGGALLIGSESGGDSDEDLQKRVNEWLSMYGVRV